MLVHLDKTVVAKRLAQSSTADVEVFDTSIVDLKCQIQPLDDSFGQDIEGSYGKDSLMFCRSADIKQDDKIIDGTDEYLVRGVEVYTFVGETHLEVRIRKI